MKTKMPTEFQKGAAWLSTPGTYHFSIVHVDDPALDKNDAALDGVRIQLSVLNEGDEQGKMFDEILWTPAETDDENSWAQRKQGAFLVAAGLVNENQAGQEIEIDATNAINRQVIVTVAKDTREGRDGRLQMSYANIFHIDDPRVAKTPKSAAAIKLIPADQRRKPESFDLERLTGKKQAKAPAANGNGNGHSNGNGSHKTADKAPAATVDLNDL